MAASAAVALHRLGSGADNKLDNDIQKPPQSNATVVLRRENGEAQRGVKPHDWQLRAKEKRAPETGAHIN